jgi:hypothetical protein
LKFVEKMDIGFNLRVLVPRVRGPVTEFPFGLFYGIMLSAKNNRTSRKIMFSFQPCRQIVNYSNKVVHNNEKQRKKESKG